MWYNRVISFIVLFLMLPLYGTTELRSQDMTFEVRLSRDTVYYGHSVQLSYIIENAQGDFEAPDFDGLKVVSGPNLSSQFSMINGVVSQKSEYTYILFPVREGLVYIGEASFNNGRDLATIEPISIYVEPNPEGLHQQPKTYGFQQRIVIGDTTKTKVDSIRQKLRSVKKYKI